jgi:hypothetical protein
MASLGLVRCQTTREYLVFGAFVSGLLLSLVSVSAVHPSSSPTSLPQFTFNGTAVQSWYLSRSDELLVLTASPNQLIAWSWKTNNASVVIQFPDGDQPTA